MSPPPTWSSFESERKYAATPETTRALLASAEAWLRPRIYDPARPIAFNRTVYLDTDDGEYERSTDQAVRKRLRLREYAAAESVNAPPTLTGARYVELKHSAGGKRLKLRARAAHDRMTAAQGTVVPEALATALAAPTLRPRLEVWYRRATYATADNRVRLTIDSDIEFADPAAPAQRLRCGPPCIVEVKFVRAPWWLGYATRTLGWPRALSKFELGMYALAVGNAVTDRVTAHRCAE